MIPLHFPILCFSDIVDVFRRPAAVIVQGAEFYFDHQPDERVHHVASHVVQQRDSVIPSHGVVVIAQLPGQHGRILRDPGGMAVGVSVLHIDDFFLIWTESSGAVFYGCDGDCSESKKTLNRWGGLCKGIYG